MKKFCYQDEEISKVMHFIAFTVYILVVMFSIKNIINNNEITGYIGMIILVSVMLLFYIFVAIIPKMKKIIGYNKIKKYGERFDGYIDSYDYKDEYLRPSEPGGNSRQIFYYILNITYENGQKTFTTPRITFNPKDLGSRSCSVYVLNNKVYATDFIKKAFNYINVWEDDNQSVVNENKVKEMYRQKIKMAFEMAIPLAILYFIILGIILFITK